ncbi:Sec-independent protein translocase protein TatB [Exilibacterium tricleocarpae]|uniref:Sec-independent protein translocase protein TatB n=1 Tax=Exilibacterium tricleocarpae TaxID=2591008 RepID=UPI001C555125|nr:Sec-independent protein translocase protein TatB [Exilibacterium tricleocarpae]
MFDIGFFELMVVAIIGLLVIGPERLPETIRTISLWVGRLRRSLRETRAELEEHLGADEIRRQLHNEEVMRSLEAARTEIDRTLNEDVLPDTSDTPAQTANRKPNPDPNPAASDNGPATADRDADHGTDHRDDHGTGGIDHSAGHNTGSATDPNTNKTTGNTTDHNTGTQAAVTDRNAAAPTEPGPTAEKT